MMKTTIKTEIPSLPNSAISMRTFEKELQDENFAVSEFITLLRIFIYNNFFLKGQLKEK